MFSSTSRKERERAQGRLADPPSPEFRPAPPVAPPVPEADEAPPATFDDAWPKSERMSERSRAELPPPRRGRAAPSTFAETNRCRERRRSPGTACAQRGSAAGDGAQIGRRRWHGLFAVFRRLDRGANARRHDAVCVDRRIARASRPASVTRLVLPGPAVLENEAPLFLCTSAVIRSYSTGSRKSPQAYWRRRDTVRIRRNTCVMAISKGSGHDRRRRQEFHRPDREHRVGLSQQQSDAGVRNSEPDQPDSRRLAAGLDRQERGAAGAGQAGGFASRNR